MKTKRFLMSLGLILILLVLGLFPSTGWPDAAQAQEPDEGTVEPAAVTNIFIRIPSNASAVIGTVNDARPLQIDNRDAAAFTNWVDLSLRFDPAIAKPVNVRLTRPNSTFRNPFTVSGNTLTFGVDFGSNPIPPLSGFVNFAEIEWEGVEPGVSPVTFNSATGSDTTITDPIPAANLAGANVNVRYPSGEIRNRLVGGNSTTITIGQTTQTEVFINNVGRIGGIHFILEYDQSVLRVEKVEASGLLAGTTPSISVANGRIDFNGLSLSPITTDGVVATIHWQGVLAGISALNFNDVQTRLLDTNGNLIVNPIADNIDNVEIPGFVYVPITVNPTPRQILFDPSPLALNVGQTQDQNIKISGLAGAVLPVNLNEVQFRVRFDPSRAQVEDADPTRPGVQISVGSLFGPTFGQVQNLVDNTGGTIDFRVRATSPINSDGVLAVVKWRGIAAGATVLTFDQITFLDNTNAPISGITTLNGLVNVSGGSSGGTISGIIRTQNNRPNQSGIQVSVSVQPCASFAASNTTTTANDGSFSFSSGAYQCLRASRPGYMIGQLASPSGDIGTRNLLAGDITGDNQINIFDLARAASVYQQADPVADYNESGTVDILDLALIALNYGRTGPVDLQ